MKKTVILILALALILAPTVLAAGEYATGGDLFQAWYDNFPDYVTGVWSTDGTMENLTFGVTDDAAGEAGREEILDLIEDDSSVTFVTQKYSRNYLIAVQEEIFPYFEKDLGLTGSGLYEMDNCVHLDILESRKGNADTDAMIAELIEKYGDAVAIYYTDGYAVDTVAAEEKAGGDNFALFAAAAIVVIGALVAVFAAKKRRAYALQTDTGIVTAAPMTAAEVEEAAKESVLEPSSDLDERIKGGF